MAKQHLNVMIDDELSIALASYATTNGMKTSEAVRTLLRHALALVGSSEDAGYREGFLAARAAVLKHLQEALAELPSVLDG